VSTCVEKNDTRIRGDLTHGEYDYSRVLRNSRVPVSFTHILALKHGIQAFILSQLEAEGC
jgi:hypothetical protein